MRHNSRLSFIWRKILPAVCVTEASNRFYGKDIFSCFAFLARLEGHVLRNFLSINLKLCKTFHRTWWCLLSNCAFLQPHSESKLWAHHFENVNLKKQQQKHLTNSHLMMAYKHWCNSITIAWALHRFSVQLSERQKERIHLIGIDIKIYKTWHGEKRTRGSLDNFIEM